jgi:heat-inducible transcriptional repressor
MHISSRQADILNFLVKEYIQKAEPISSGLIEKISDFDISAATIRNDLQELTRKKFITQPHTSGGRIPTDRAYRFYVNELVRNSDLDPSKSIKNKVHKAIDSTLQEPGNINKTVAELVADLSDNLVIANTRESHDFYKVGLSGLFELPEFREFDRMFNVTNFFEHFESMFNELERSILKDFFAMPAGGESHQEESIKVVIGAENPLKNIQKETVILAKYFLPEHRTGTLTMVGPTRMDYEKNLSLVKCVVEEINNKTLEKHKLT